MIAKNNNEIEKFVEEYEKQIELMKKQYGQEEDMYPWIYMVLMKSGKINELSMRQVARASWANCVRGRELLRGYAGFPDIAILDKKFCAIDVSKSISYKLEDVNKWIQNDLDENKICDKPNNIKSNKKTKEFLRKYWYLHNIDKIRGCIEVKGVGENLINVISGDNTLEIAFEEKDLIFNVSGVNCLSSLKKGIKIKDVVQLFGEILWYGKVLYTNGKEWKYIEVTKCSNEKQITTIVDLREKLYADYVNIHKPVKEWYRCISKLQKNGLNIKINCKIKSDEDDLITWIKENVNFEVN